MSACTQSILWVSGGGSGPSQQNTAAAEPLTASPDGGGRSDGCEVGMHFDVWQMGLSKTETWEGVVGESVGWQEMMWCSGTD